MAVVLGYNCTNNDKSLGFTDCRVIEGQPTGHIRVPKGWEVDLSTLTGTLKEYIEEQIQAKRFVILANCFSSVSETPESTTEESPRGLMDVVRKGLTKITNIFKNGYEFHASLYSQDGTNKYDILPVYASNVIKVVRVSGTTIKGFSAGMYDVGGYQENDGSKSQQTTLTIQLTDAYEWNTQGAFLTDLGFNVNTGLNNILGVTLTGRADVSEGKIYVKAVWEGNPLSPPISVFEKANFAVTINGVAETISGTTTPFNALTGEYAITPTTTLATTQSIIVKLYDSTKSLDVVKQVNRFYTGETNAITPVA